MDELEISGKRYISTKRAGKEHGYHSDYIGQLIRGKKVVGQKVGRAWYVDEESLTEYLGKEPAQQEQQSEKQETKSEEPVVLETTKEEEKEVEEKVEEKIEEVKEEPVEIVEIKKEIAAEPVIVVAEKKVETADGYRVAIHTPGAMLGGLKYVEDSEPLLPQTGERALTARMETRDEEIVEEVAPRKKFSLVRASMMLVVGVVLFAATAAVCTYSASKVVLAEGQTASVNYIFDF